ncbi:MAG: ATP-binding protein, partial [Candidatus Promineifilaceae bacterium]
MNLPQASILVPLIFTGIYAFLLIGLVIRLGWQEQQVRWLLALLFVGIVWELAMLPTPLAEQLINLPDKILLVNTFILGMATAAFIDWERQPFWTLLAGVTTGGIFVLDFLFPMTLFPSPSQTTLIPTVGGLLIIPAWFILNMILLRASWRGYRQAQLPLHGNRLLFWAMSLLVLIIGEALIFINQDGIIISGQIIRVVGLVGLAYAVYSHRIFDVRTRLRRIIAFFFVALVSAGFGTAIIFLLQEITRQQTPTVRTATIIIVAAVGLLLYPRAYRFLERLLYRYFLGVEFDNNKILRNYSQAVARTLDVEQLSIVIIGTISELLETNRGSLMLITRVGDNYNIQPIPAMGRIPQETATFFGDSLLLYTLATQRQPLLQYELDFNPQLQQISEEEKNWLADLAMDVFVPINTDNELTGIIALGPKSSGQTYRPNELELLQVLADQTVVALQNARLYSELGSQNDRIRFLNADLRQQNSRLEIMDRVKSDFITIASHELRTPLTQVKGYADILQAMNDENALTQDQTKEIVGHINRATTQLERLISAMLDASQLDVDGMRLTYVQARLETVIRLALEPLVSAMKERRISLKLSGITSIPDLQADFKRLVQAFGNIIGNAIKYTPDGGSIAISADCLTAEDGEEYIEVVVADTGIGIDPKYHELIFEKFFRIGSTQLHSTGSTKFKGAGPGLGLPIAKGVIEAHSGRIWVES